MEVGLFYLPSVGRKEDIEQGMAGKRTDLYQMMLKEMRDAGEGLKSGLWDSSAGDSYEEMFDAELSTSLAKSQGIGMTDWLVRQLENPGGLAAARKGMGVSAYQSLASVR